MGACSARSARRAGVAVSPVIFKVVLAYLSAVPSGEEVYCDAMAVCQGEACVIVPTESCAGSWDPESDELRGSWDGYQRNHADVLVANRTVGRIEGTWPRVNIEGSNEP